MVKEFIPYEIALELKELGFDFQDYDLLGFYSIKYGVTIHAQLTKSDGYNPAPLYQQAFRWLYQKLDIEKGVMPLDIKSQQLLLKELIDKVSSKHLLV